MRRHARQPGSHRGLLPPCWLVLKHDACLLLPQNAVGLWLRPEVYVAISERLAKDDDEHLMVSTLRSLASVKRLVKQQQQQQQQQLVSVRQQQPAVPV